MVDSSTGKEIESQKKFVPGGVEYSIWCEIKPYDERFVELVVDNTLPIVFFDSFSQRGTDGPRDIQGQVKECFTTYLETDSIKVSWEQSKGITSIVDKLKDKELVFGDFGAFSPIYEITPVKDLRDVNSVRGKMGRNRKGFNVERSVGQLVDVKSFSDGELWLEAELEYQCKGMQFYRVNLKLWKEIQRLEVKV
ncbi:MAG: hypothetical protein P9L91_04250, partial [Candidatus Zophobacter franzmannii]|nr:hypothetical protein [Candidatus Zophobacter franzmannii]